MKKFWQNSSSAERILIFLSGALLMLVIMILASYEKIFTKNKVHADDQIGSVMYSDNSVRRRIPMSYGFDGLNEGDLIGTGDSIFSDKGSQVLIKFNQGSMIMVGEQSLVILRELDGKLDLKIEKGGISGQLEDVEVIEIQAAEESVTIYGEKEAEFSVSYKPGLGMEIIGFEKNINVKYRGNEVNLKDQKAIVSKKNGVKTSKRDKSNDGGRDPKKPKEEEKTAEKAPPPEPAKPPKGVDVEKPKEDLSLTLVAPFPSNDQIFFHNTGGKIAVFPKKDCIDGCSLKVAFNGKPGVEQKFGRGSVPILILKIKPKFQSKVTWEFKDGAESSHGFFEVLPNNEANFGKALLQNKKIEVIN